MPGKKQNYYKTGDLRRHKEKLRREAMERQEARNNRTALEQLNLIQDRPGNSTKEKNKLLALVA